MRRAKANVLAASFANSDVAGEGQVVIDLHAENVDFLVNTNGFVV